MNTPELNNFTLLRLALALLVVLGHFADLPGDKPAGGLFAYADFAVDTFFVVSGYLIYASFDNRPALGSFYIRRVFRIYPLYLVVVLVQALVMAELAGGITKTGDDMLRYLALNLMMANFMAHDVAGLLSGLHNPGINPSLWTLKIEFAFYLILPLLWYMIQRLGGWLMALIYVASTAYVFITLHYGMDTFAKQLPGQMRFFVVGIALYHYRARLTFPTLPLAALAAGLFAICDYFSGVPAVMPLYPVSCGLVMLVCVFRLPLVPVPFDISYGVYLIHGPLIQLALLLGFFRDTAGFLAILLATVLLLALTAERLIEQPGIEIGKRLARRWTARFNNAGA